MKSKEAFQNLAAAAAFMLFPGDDITINIAPPISGSLAQAAPHDAVLQESKPFSLPSALIDRRKKPSPVPNYFKARARI